MTQTVILTKEGKSWECGDGCCTEFWDEYTVDGQTFHSGHFNHAHVVCGVLEALGHTNWEFDHDDAFSASAAEVNREAPDFVRIALIDRDDPVTYETLEGTLKVSRGGQDLEPVVVTGAEANRIHDENWVIEQVLRLLGYRLA